MTRVLSNRNLNRSIHVGLGALLGCYVYWPEFREHPAGAIVTQAVVLPLVTLSGLWLWKGKQVLRALQGRSAPAVAVPVDSHTEVDA
ncbi:MAG TPA: hypothetical protein VG815_18580 [Chloroflexota bacterium]|nr:hypothetical protein [Chloroflexota bacterium]